MKKIVMLLSVLMLIACSNRNRKKYSITDFNSKIIDTIYPQKNESYVCKIIKIKGYTNDSIYVSFGKDNFKQYFSGNIDVLLNPDYYGTGEVIFTFDPYKATKGNIDLEFAIQ